MDDDEADEDFEWDPLRVFALYAEAPALDNPLLEDVLRREFTEVEVDDAGIAVTHPALLGATLDGNPDWGLTCLEAAVPPPLAAYTARPLGAPRVPVPPSARAALCVSEELPSYMGTDRRLEAFSSVLATLVRATPVLALAWECGRVITAPEPQRDTWGYIGLRRRRSELDPRGWRVDTVGLATFELPDVSCHFVGLDVAAVERDVARHAEAVLRGDEFIADGDPVLREDGSWFEAVWSWGHEPERHVIALVPDEGHRLGDDLDPGRDPLG